VSPEERRETGRGRQQLEELGVPLLQIDDDAGQRLGRLLMDMESNPVAPSEPAEEEDIELDVKATRASFMRHVAGRKFCREQTGAVDFKALQLEFAYLNARGALSNLTLWRGAATNQDSEKDTRGRPAILQPFEAFVLFKVVLRQGMSRLSPFVFGVSASTVSRTFRTFLRAICYIMGKHQPWPSAAAMLACTSVETRDSLGLGSNTVNFKGDATEWAVLKPTAYSSGVWSEYKHDHTMKYNAMILPNDYMVEISRGYAGRTSDNQLHKVDGIPGRLAAATHPHVPVLVYDKGLNNIPSLADNGVMLLRPLGKQSGQVAFRDEDADWCRAISSFRVNIENCFGEMGEFKAFGREIRLTSVADADMIASMVRCTINLRPPRAKNGLEATPVGQAGLIDV
jgi:hypothetical protein